MDPSPQVKYPKTTSKYGYRKLPEFRNFYPLSPLLSREITGFFDIPCEMELRASSGECLRARKATIRKVLGFWMKRGGGKLNADGLLCEALLIPSSITAAIAANLQINDRLLAS